MTPATLVRLVLTHAIGAVIAVGIVFGEFAWGGSFNVAAPSAILLIATQATGWLLAAKLPRNPIGWVLMWIAAFFISGPPAQQLGQVLRHTAPGAAAWLYWFAGTAIVPSWAWIPPVWALLIWIPLHFPNGRVPSPRWRWFSWVTIALLAYASIVFATAQGPIGGFANPVAVPAVREVQGQLFLLAVLCLALCFVGTIASLVVRYRHGSVVLRAQLRWMLWAVAITILLYMVGFALPTGDGTDVYDDWTLAAFGLIPIAIAVGVLRYRLYEIDRIISRTAAYALVTLVVVGTYGVVVVLVGLLPALQGSGIGVALATLAAAAVFLPVLRLARRSIDRVFDRAQYDADRVVDTFGERIRNGADPHTAGADLTAAIQQTLQPSAIGIWTAK